MTKFSPEYHSLADELLRQYALTEDDKLFAILTKENLGNFQSQYAGGRIRNFPPLRTLSLFMHQVGSDNKSCRNALIAESSLPTVRRSPCPTQIKIRKRTLNTVRKKGVGNPLLRIDILTTLGSEAVVVYAVTPCKGKQTGEVTLFKQLVGQLKAGGIVLGDAIFVNYFLLALLQIGDIDAVCEKNGARHVDFRQYDQKLGKKTD